MNESRPHATSGQKHFIGAGVVVLRHSSSEAEVLLIQRGKPPRKGEWSIPGGRQEFGEKIRETAQRELQEETGLTLKDLTLVDIVDACRMDSSANIHWTLVDFCTLWDGTEAHAGSDAEAVRWVPLSRLDDYNLWTETIRIIAEASRLLEMNGKSK